MSLCAIPNDEISIGIIFQGCKLRTQKWVPLQKTVSLTWCIGSTKPSRRWTPSVLSDSATSSNFNASYFLTVKDNIMFDPIFWIAQLESDPNHIRHARLSLMIKKLDAIKIYEIAESGNIGSPPPCPCPAFGYLRQERDRGWGQEGYRPDAAWKDYNISSKASCAVLNDENQNKPFEGDWRTNVVRIIFSTRTFKWR